MEKYVPASTGEGARTGCYNQAWAGTMSSQKNVNVQLRNTDTEGGNDLRQSQAF